MPGAGPNLDEVTNRESQVVGRPGAQNEPGIPASTYELPGNKASRSRNTSSSVSGSMPTNRIGNDPSPKNNSPTKLMRGVLAMPSSDSAFVIGT